MKFKDFLNESKNEYIKLLKNFDWNYQYADDNRAYKKGVDDWKKIQELGKLVDKSGKILDEYRPKTKAVKQHKTKVDKISKEDKEYYQNSEKERQARQKKVNDMFSDIYRAKR